MIHAKVTAVKSGQNGGADYAFATARALQSAENPRGIVTFTLAPDNWAVQRAPAVGEMVVLKRIERRMRPEWRSPRLRAFGVKPTGREPNSLPPERFAPRASVKRGLWTRFVGVLLLRRKTDVVVHGDN